MQKMSVNQDLNQRQFEREETGPHMNQLAETAPYHKKGGYRQYVAPYLNEFDRIQEKGMMKMS